MGLWESFFAGLTEGKLNQMDKRLKSIEGSVNKISKQTPSVSKFQVNKESTRSGKTETIKQSPSGHIRIDRTPDGTLWELVKDLESNVIISVKKLDQE